MCGLTRRLSDEWVSLVPWVSLGIVAALALTAVVLGRWGGVDLLTISLSAVVGVVFGVTGALVAARLPHNSMGWIFCAFALLSEFGALGDAYISSGEGELPGQAWVAWTSEWLVNAFSPALIALAFLLFPTGKLLSVRWQLLFWAVVLVSIVHAISSALAPGPLTDSPFENPIGIETAPTLRAVAEGSLIFLAAPLMLLCAASIFVRLRRASGIERQQLKWFAYAAALVVLFLVVVIVLDAILGEGGRAVELASFMVFVIVISSIPASMGVAILRYRLYDIDVVINRTLVYGSLTFSLVALYLGGVATTQAIFRVLTDQQQQPQLAVVASTLIIAALFNPLRRRIQAFIDRRFYRNKYDARKTLEDFGARLRDETDLDALGDGLVAVARESVQPAHVSLWLRPPDEGGRR